MKTTILSTAILFLFATNTMDAQLLTNALPEASIDGSNAFLDLSTFYSSIGGEDNNRHKGLVFPDVDLTTFEFETTVADGVTFPSFYDGMIVYNTATGDTSTAGSNPSTAFAVEPGFYYFSNPQGASNFDYSDGEWLPIGGSSRVDITSIPTETNTSVNGTPVNVVRLTGSANGTDTLMDLGTASLPANAVAEFREAKIYNSSGELLLIASGDYNTATNVFTTGDGMMNKLLPSASDYEVELYYLPNTAP